MEGGPTKINTHKALMPCGSWGGGTPARGNEAPNQGGIHGVNQPLFKGVGVYFYPIFWFSLQTFFKSLHLTHFFTYQNLILPYPSFSLKDFEFLYADHIIKVLIFSCYH